MPQLRYLGADDLPDDERRAVYLDLSGQRWKLVALLVHVDPETGQEIGRTAFLRRADGRGGDEWETPWDLLQQRTARTV